MSTIVSITPLGVDVDSRTLKEAATVGRLGYESVVVQGWPPAPREQALPFEVRSVHPQSEGVAVESPRTPAGAQPSPRSWLFRPTSNRLLRALRLPLVLLLLPLAFLRVSVRTARRSPAAALYYLHSFDQFPAVWWLARRHGAPFVYDAHDMYSVLHDPGTLQERLEIWLRKRVERACVRRADATVTVSEGLADLHEAAFGRRPAVVRNCHDSRLDVPVARDVRSVTGASEEDLLLVVSGNRKTGLASDALLSAMQELPPRVKLAMVGAGWDALHPEVSRRGLEERVHLIPAQPPEEIVPFIRSADLAPILYYGLTPSHEVALPNGFFHAVAAGLPVLYPPLADLVGLAAEHGLGLQIDPRDPESIRSAVEGLLADPSQLARLCSNVEAARPALSWKREETRLIAVVSPLLQGD
jgi:glycosyltransferase involved in cell wall biosynthesis